MGDAIPWTSGVEGRGKIIGEKQIRHVRLLCSTPCAQAGNVLEDRYTYYPYS